MQADTAIVTHQTPSRARARASRSGATPAACRHRLGFKPRNPKRASAFTLIELLVAISVLSLMMALATRIFFDAQQGVQRGLQTSQIIAESRSISQPLARDLREMYVFESKYGSNSPGFLAIVQQEFNGVRYPRPQQPSIGSDGWITFLDYNDNFNTNDMPDRSPGYFEPSAMRSDQIALFRDATGLESLTPGSNGQYDSQARARHARVWYGHVSPVVDTDGNPSTVEASLNPGDADYDLASQLVIGRQTLLLIENDERTTYPDGSPGANNTASGNTNRIAPGGNSVRGSLYGGLHDVYDLQKNTFYDVGLYDDGGVDPTDPAEVGLFRTPTYDTPAPVNPSFFGPKAPAGLDGLPTPLYAQFALDWLYARDGQRLQARTSIENNFNAGIFTADEIAQLHAAFAPHVADFAIEFAADWTDTDPQDRDGDGNYLEADGLPDGEPDRDGDGDIIWYTAAFYANPDNNNDGYGDNNSILPVTYPIPTQNQIAAFDGTPSATLAALPFHPFAYEFDPNSGAVQPYDGVNSENVAFVWSHTGDRLEDDPSTTPRDESVTVEGAGKYWPYLIRFRFRLMDGKGEFRTIQTNPALGEDYSEVGRWFEQIVPVARPEVSL